MNIKNLLLNVFASALTMFSSLNATSQTAETWRATEFSFESKTDYSADGADNIALDVQFTHTRSGKTLVRPAFWDGGNIFRVRFAPTESGTWQWHTTCQHDASLAGLHGELKCRKYKGKLDIYRHGFVTVTPGRKYLTYADGTPFFYLADTHWGMYREELDKPGPHAGKTRATSHFKYIVDRRKEQGFTAYQSEPIDARFILTDGKVDQADIEGFREADRYYQYIADAGLVHANAELFFASDMNAKLHNDRKALESLARYWNARFGAYPVMWTLAQEVDNDFYSERGDQKWYDYTCNPWVTFAHFLHKHDCYSHPLSAHQENTLYTSITGAGVDLGRQPSGNGVSAFASEEAAKRTGHNWWAVQWSPSLTATPSSATPRDYWNSERPAVNYEGRYCYLWTKDFGARAQGWISFLSGFCGYGYGAIDMWLYQSIYDIDNPSHDGKEEITVEDKAVMWSEAVEFESAHQMSILKAFFQSFDWWNLAPVFQGDAGFNASKYVAYAHARTSKGNNVLYFYSTGTATGSLNGVKAGSRYKAAWFNPRTGNYASQQVVCANEDGTMPLPAKPDDLDWVLVIKVKQ